MSDWNESVSDGGETRASLGPAKEVLVSGASPVRDTPLPRDESRWFWIKLILQPVLFLLCGLLLFVFLGVAQRYGWIRGEGGATGGASVSANAKHQRYICPMMCTPPLSEPGRCPVCGMELVPATADGGHQNTHSVQIQPAARRLANIRTVAVTSMPVTHTIRAIGEIRYDEGSLKTISAYVDGRLDRLYVDYTGAVVRKGDDLALLYSPELYSGQVELLFARKSRGASGISSNDDLYRSARERLLLLGMTDPQIDQLESAGQATSRLRLQAPISGTVIEKKSVEGEYVAKGDVIFRLADLSSVWLMLRLFPEDAAMVRYGQKVEAELQSMPGQTFGGRVAFIDPQVDPKTRTVGVRVTMPNDAGLVRIGDYAKATLEVPPVENRGGPIYDPELAHKWISPRHPHVIADAPGTCPICGVPLVPASQFGFTEEPGIQTATLVVPRDAVLVAGNNSVVYVETAPGEFEMRRVVLGPHSAGKTIIRSGVQLGERIAVRGNFLIDSQMQLAGNPSLIDPTKANDKLGEPALEELLAALADLSPEDRALAQQQVICPVTESPLGSMGTPLKIDVNGKAIFICCEGCREALLSEPDKYLARLTAGVSDHARDVVSPTEEETMELPPIAAPQEIPQE